MLNWIAIWIGVWLFGLGGPLQSDVDKSVPVSADIVGGREAAGVLGRSRAAGPARRAVHRARRAGRVLGAAQPHGDRLRGARGRLQPGRRAGVGHQRRAQLRARDGGLRPVRRARRARSTCSAGSSGSPPTTSRSRQIGFLGIAVALLGRNTAVGTLFSALLFGALLTGTSVRNLDPAVFPPELARRADVDHPGPDRAARQRGHPGRLPVAAAAQAAAAEAAAPSRRRPGA